MTFKVRKVYKSTRCRWRAASIFFFSQLGRERGGAVMRAMTQQYASSVERRELKGSSRLCLSGA